MDLSSQLAASAATAMFLGIMAAMIGPALMLNSDSKGWRIASIALILVATLSFLVGFALIFASIWAR